MHTERAIISYQKHPEAGEDLSRALDSLEICPSPEYR